MRQDKIIEYLYLQGQAVPATVLIEQFQISQRTLANDIKLIKELGKQNGFSIKRIRNKGYLLAVINQEQFQDYLAALTMIEQIDSSYPQERIKNIELLLLLRNEYTTLQQIAEGLGVSLSTVKADMKQVEVFCERYQLQLQSKAHYGVKIGGSESQKRRAILYLIRQTIHLPLLTEKYKEFNFCFDEEELSEQLKAYLQTNYIKVSDVVFENILQHIKLLSFRILQNNSLSEEEITIQDEKDEYGALTLQLIRYLETRYGIHFSLVEQNYLKDQLRGKFAMDINQSSNRQLAEMIRRTLDTVDQRYPTNFKEDQELADALLLHVAPLLQRLYSGHQLENPLIDDIYTQYANVFSLALTFINLLNEDLELPISKDEVGYVAIYFAASLEKQTTQIIQEYQKIAVICATGGGASYLLKVNLERLFNNATVSTFALNEINQIDQGFDLIISTVPLEEQCLNQSVPVIFTKSILTQTEISKIEKDLSLLRSTQPSTVDVDHYLFNLFQAEWFQILDEPQEYLSLLQQEGERLEKQGMAEAGYSLSVIKRETMIDTIYQNGIAGPHPMEQSARQEVINVILLRKPAIYQQKAVKVIFLINIKSEHLTLHKEISRLMIQLIDDPELEQQLNAIKNFQDFRTYLQMLITKG